MKLFKILILAIFLSIICSINSSENENPIDADLENIGKWLKSLFNTGEKCLGPVIREMKKWGIYKMNDDPTTKVLLKLDDFKDKIDMPSVHIDKVLGCANKNSYLLQAIKDGKSKFLNDYEKWDENNKATFSKVSKDAVCYSTFLTFMTGWIESDYERSSLFFDQINEFIAKYSIIDIKGFRYYKNMDTFGNIKINTVFIMMKGMMNEIKNKIVLKPDPKKCNIRLNRISFNIAEAMFFDSANGFKDNALTGSALVVTPAYETTDKDLETEPPKYSENGVYQVFQPFPDQWADLYQVWNMAFTAQEMKEWPMYWAKLLTPAVGCYRDLKGSYLFQRAINLAMHIVHQLIIKNERKSNDPKYDLRTLSFVKSFGTSNKLSAQNYIDKIQSNDKNEKSRETRKRKLDLTNDIVNSIKENRFMNFFQSLPSIITKLNNLRINECLTFNEDYEKYNEEILSEDQLEDNLKHFKKRKNQLKSKNNK